MCNINPISQTLEQQMLAMGLSVISKVIEASLSENQPQPTTTDVLSAATQAYQRGHITKAQYFAVINALDETTTVQTTATSEPSWNQEYISAHRYLNQYLN